MLITDIIPQKRKKGRVNIYLDGRFAFSLDLGTLLTEKLEINQEISQEKLEKLIKKGEFNNFYQKVLKLISLRPRSEKEIIDYLRKKNAGENEINLVIKKLKELGLVNDINFVNWWFEQRFFLKPKSLRAIKIELLNKGIKRQIIDEVLREKGLNIDFEIACKLAKKFIKRNKKLPSVKIKEKLSNFLFQRGFDWEIIKKIIDENENKE